MIENLVTESIKIYGHNVCYIPRTIENYDPLFGEDTLSKFMSYNIIEAYIKNVEGFEGQGRFLSKFGLEIRDQITFTIAKSRFEQIRTEKLVDESGWNLQQENTDVYLMNSENGLLLENGNVDQYSITSERPLAGDLIYFPLVNKLFEIKYVNYETIFYQLGNLYVYDLQCELFEYSNERVQTGHTDIDAITSLLNSDIKNFEFMLENGDLMQMEDGDSLVDEESAFIENVDKQANNNLFKTESNNVVDWSEKSPFVTGDTHLKW